MVRRIGRRLAEVIPMRLKIATGLSALAFAAAFSVAATASPLGSGSFAAAPVAATTDIEQVQYYYYGPPRYYAGPGYYRHNGYYYRRGWRGNGVAAGVAAGAIGALAIGGLAASGAFDPAPPPIAPPRRQWCMDRFRSYNPADGTYVDNRGRVRYCG
jgi:hypothetical protein